MGGKDLLELCALGYCNYTVRQLYQIEFKVRSSTLLNVTLHEGLRQLSMMYI